jgi:hypothetical protein
MKYFTNVQNMEFPLSKHLSYNYIQIDGSIYKKQNCFFKKGELTSEDGLIGADTHFYESFSLDNWTLDMMQNINFNRQIAVTRIYFTRVVEKFSRIYVKFQDLSPILMSFFKIISIFFSTIAAFLNDFTLTNKIVNELFDFSHLNKNVSSKLEERKRELKRISMMKHDETDHHFTPSKDGNQNKSPEIHPFDKSVIEKSSELIIFDNKKGSPKNMHLEDRVLKFSERKSIVEKFKDCIISKKFVPNEEMKKFLFEKGDDKFFLPLKIKLKSLCCKKFLSEEESNLYKIFKKGRTILKEKTDIVSFLKNMDDMNEMKFILFNKFQAMCFNFIRKPSLDEHSLNDKFSKLFNSIKDDEVSQKMEIVDYFIKQSKKPKQSKYDKSFLDFLEEDIKTVIESVNGTGQFIIKA